MTIEMREILKGKQSLRRRLAVLPLVEKLRLMDRLHERSLAIAASRARRQTQRKSPSDKQTDGC